MGESWAGTARRRAGCAGGLALRLLGAALIAAWVGGAAAGSAAGHSPDRRAAGAAAPWPQVERLVTGQRLQDAVRLLQSIHKTAQAAHSEDDAARAAIRLAQVRMTLSHYELAVAVLHDELQRQLQASARRLAPGAAPVTGQPSATDSTRRLAQGAPPVTGQPSATDDWRALLAMFYARALGQYAQMYSFQVGQRERGASPVAPDAPFVSTLRAWTRDELFAEAQVAMATAWELRAALGRTPATALPAYIEPGTLPRQAQPTLRDLLTYQYVELLASRKLWPAELPPAVLPLGRGQAAAGELAVGRDRLLDGRLHPLAKLAAVLLDLAGWHEAAGRSAAALAAHLERLARLHEALPDPGQRAQLRVELAERAAAASELPAQASAQAMLAELLQREFEGRPDPERQLLRAYAIAAQGARRFAELPGGKRCRAVLQSLAAPEFRLSSQAADAAGRRALQVEHKNLPVLHLRAYLYDPIARLLDGHDELHPSGREVEALLRSGQHAVAWTVALPATPELQRHLTLVTPPLETPGFYVIIGSARADFAPARNHLEAVHLQLSEVVLWATGDSHGVHITAVSGRTGEPLPDVELAVYELAPASPGARPAIRPAELATASAPRRSPATLVHSARTGPEGAAALPRSDAERVLVGRLGTQVALLERVPQLEADEPEVRYGAIIYADRSVYGPRQKVLWKLAAYQSAQAPSLGPPAPERNAPVTVSLIDPRAQEVARVTVTTNQLGTAAGEFTLPGDRQPGPWRLLTWHGAAPTGELLLQAEGLPSPAGQLGAPGSGTPDLAGVPAPGSADGAPGLPILLRRERSQVRVGETARFTALSDLDEQALFFEVRHPGGRVERRLLRTGPAPGRLELPVQPADRGQLLVTLTAVRAYQLTRLEQLVSVLDDGALRLELSACREPLRPGARETCKVTVRTAAGAIPAAGTTELLAYMYDRSLDSLVPQRPPELASHDGRPQSARALQFAHSLGSSSPDWLAADTSPELPSRAAPRPDRLRLRLNFSLVRAGSRLGPAPAPLAERWRDATPSAQPIASTASTPAPSPTPLTPVTAANSPTAATSPSATAATAAPTATAAGAVSGPDGGRAGPPDRPGGAGVGTAFFLPHLQVQPDGSAAIEFTVPAASAQWNLRVIALTTDLRGGALTRPTPIVELSPASPAARGPAAPPPVRRK